MPFALSMHSAAMRGNTLAVQLNEKAYSECLTLCWHSLIERVILSKGEDSWKLQV